MRETSPRAHSPDRRLPRVLRIGLILFLLPGLGAMSCAKSDPTGSGATTIRFVTWKPNQPEVWDRIHEIFARENPDVQVSRELAPHSSTAYHDLLTQKLKNRSTDVDVFLMDVIWPPEFAAAGWAEPLDPFFSPTAREEFIPGTILANTYAGSIYGVPLYMGSGILYYRKDLLEKYGLEPPATWEELVSQAAEIVGKENVAGEKLYGFSGQFKQYEGLVCDVMEYILSAGGDILDPKTGRSALHEEPAVAAVRFVRNSIIGDAAPAGALTYEEPESLSLFVQGKAVFHRNWPYAWEVANNPDKSMIEGRVGIARLPHFEGGESVSTLGGWQVGISRFSAHKDAAWRFAEFLTSHRIQALLAVDAGLAPTRQAVYEDPEVQQAQPHLASMKNVFVTARPRPRTPLYPAVSNVLQRYFSSAIASDTSDIPELAVAATREIDGLLGMAAK